MSRPDILIVGARAAGAATALLLARAGAAVRVIDRGQYGADTLSTHSLMRPAVLQLHRWGALPRIVASGATPIRASRFFYGAAPTTVAVKRRDGVDALYAPRRTVLDRVLVDLAIAAGARVEFGVSLRELRRAGGRMLATVTSGAEAHTIETGLVIGADGRHSRVAELMRADLLRTGRHASAVVYGYWTGLDIRDYWWSYGDQVSAGAIPTNDRATCVFASIPAGRFAEVFGADLPRGYRAAIAAADADLSARLHTATLNGSLRGFAGSAGYVRQSWGPGWALVGDAAHFKDPITAHGISDALRDAELLAGAVVAGTPAAFAAYQAERDRLSAPVFEVSDRLASYDWDARGAEACLRELSDAMAHEARAILAWPATAPWLTDRSTTPSAEPAPETPARPAHPTPAG